MLAYIIRRIAYLVPVLFVLTVVGLHLRRDAARQHHRHAGRHRGQQRSRGPQDPREGVRARSAGLYPLRQVAVPRRAGRLRHVAGDAPAGLGRAAVGHTGHGLSRGRRHIALDADRRAARHDRRRQAQHGDRLHRAGHLADRHLDPRVLVRHPLRAVLLALPRLAALLRLRQPVRGSVGQPEVPDPAGGRGRLPPGRLHHAADALEHARRDEQGVRRHRALGRPQRSAR